MPDQGPAGLSVADAADRLGISRVALRKRLRRGSLTAYKVDGEWRVVLPEGDAGPPVRNQPEDAPSGGAVGPDARDALIQHLEDEVRFLRELTEHQAGVIADLTRRPAELPAGPESSATAPTGGPESGERRPGWWWRAILWFRRKGP